MVQDGLLVIGTENGIGKLFPSHECSCEKRECTSPSYGQITVEN